MSLAWQFQQNFDLKPKFFLVDSEQGDETQAIQNLLDALLTVPRPFQLWMVNIPQGEKLKSQNCSTQDRKSRRATGYVYQMYTCR